MSANLKLGRRDFLRASGALVAGSVVGGSSFEALAQSAPAKKFTITIANTGGNSTLTLEEILKRKGYMEELGVEATTINVADSAKIISGIIGGDIDCCMLAGFGQVLPAVEKGARLKVLGGANTLTPNSLFSSKPDVKTLKDLEGRTIGTGSLGSVLHQVTVALLMKNNVDVSKVQFVNVGATGDILKAVVAGTVDAGTVNVDTYGVAEKFKIHPIADFFKELKEYPFQGSFSSENVIKTKREALVRTLAAHGKLFRFISGPTSKDDYVSAYIAATGGTSESAVAQWQFIQDSQPYAVNLVLPEKDVQYMQQLNVQMGVQKAIVPNKDVADMSLAEEAVKLI